MGNPSDIQSPNDIAVLLSFTILEEDRAAKQTEVTLLMDEVERAQTRLLSLEREKVCFSCLT